MPRLPARRCSLLALPALLASVHTAGAQQHTPARRAPTDSTLDGPFGLNMSPGIVVVRDSQVAHSGVEVCDGTRHQSRAEPPGSGPVVQMGVEDDRVVRATLNGLKYMRARTTP